MTKSIHALVLLLVALLVATTTPLSAESAASGPVLPPDVAEMFGGFPDFGYMLSPQELHKDHPGVQVFRIKTDFPKKMPTEKIAALDIDFTTDAKEYLLSVREYCLEDNTPSWDPWLNETRDWYHIPWLHPSSESGYPPNGGTEGFHGLIKEAPVGANQLGANQANSYQIYANTLVNSYAGYTMGRMWGDGGEPDPRAADDRFGSGFPVGTVFCKLLFIDGPRAPDILPFLDNPIEWTGYITTSWDSPTRAPQPVRLLQMDIMVRDPRSATTGWVFGTFAYNGQLNQANKFHNLVPLGLQWGNDPDVKTNTTDPFPPGRPKVNPKLKETIITDSPELPPQHLGWNGRLNGPADLNTSSCMSCHFAASYPAVTSLIANGMVPHGGKEPPKQGGSPAWMQWFQNYSPTDPMGPTAYQTGLSLQVAIALENYHDMLSSVDRGRWAGEYATREPISRDGGAAAAAEHK